MNSKARELLVLGFLSKKPMTLEELHRETRYSQAQLWGILKKLMKEKKLAAGNVPLEFFSLSENSSQTKRLMQDTCSL